MKPLDVVNEYRASQGLSDFEKQITCWAPFQAMHIDKKGNIRPCSFALSHGEIDNETVYAPKWSPEKSLLECWNSEVFEEMRLESMSGNLKEGYCDYCIRSTNQEKPPSSLDYDWVGGARSIAHDTPREIELELSNTCNYMCSFCSPFCSSQHMERMGLQNDETFISVFDDPEIKKAFIEDLRSIIHNLHRLNFTGGEPFAQRVVFDILKMIDEEQPKNLSLHFTTNGSVMNGIVKKLAKRPNTRFTVSLDTLDPELYPELRVNGDFNNVMSNIETFLTSGSQVGCSFVVSKKNVRELPRIVSWCNKKDIEFTYHMIEPMWWGKEYEDIINPMKVELETKEYLDELKTYLKNSNIDISSTDKELSHKNIRMFKQYIERIK